MKIIRISTISCLLLSLLTLGACKKTVYNTVNQVFSAVYTVKPTDWTTTDGGHVRSVSLSVPEVDDVVVSNGGVETYISTDKGASYVALPQTFLGVSYGSTHSKGYVTIDLQDAIDPGTYTVPLPSDNVLIKVVILDGQPLD